MAMRDELDYEFKLRKNGGIFPENQQPPSTYSKTTSPNPPGYFLWHNGTTRTNPVDVMGRYYHAVQLTGIGSDSIQVEGTIDGVNWVSVGSALSSNGISQFTGLFWQLRATKTGSSSATTVLTLLSVAP